MLGKRYYRKKSLRLKEEEGVITEEEKEEMNDMKVLKMDKLKHLIRVKMEGLSSVLENTGYCYFKPIVSSHKCKVLVEEGNVIHGVLVCFSRRCDRFFVHQHV